MCKHASVYKSMSRPRTAAKLAVDMLSLQIKPNVVKRGSNWLLAKEKIWRDVHQRRRTHAKLIAKQVHVDMTSPNSAKIRKQRSNVPVPL